MALVNTPSKAHYLPDAFPFPGPNPSQPPPPTAPPAGHTALMANEESGELYFWNANATPAAKWEPLT